VTAVDLDTETGNSSTTGHVMVVNSGSKLERRDVTIGMETANRVEIRSGLQSGEMVVIGNRSGLQQGQVVKPKVTTLLAKESR
jgi:multidrug efflux pump subunit AcrA (membrane-fusion protein)